MLESGRRGVVGKLFIGVGTTSNAIYLSTAFKLHQNRFWLESFPFELRHGKASADCMIRFNLYSLSNTLTRNTNRLLSRIGNKSYQFKANLKSSLSGIDFFDGFVVEWYPSRLDWNEINLIIWFTGRNWSFTWWISKINNKRKKIFDTIRIKAFFSNVNNVHDNLKTILLLRILIADKLRKYFSKQFRKAFIHLTFFRKLWRL